MYVRVTDVSADRLARRSILEVGTQPLRDMGEGLVPGGLAKPVAIADQRDAQTIRIVVQLPKRHPLRA